MPSIIRIKRSGIDETPTNLKVGELAYSYASGSNKLYIGIGPEVDATGTAASIVIVGGAKYTDILSGVGGISVANAALVLGAAGAAIAYLVEFYREWRSRKSTDNAKGAG